MRRMRRRKKMRGGEIVPIIKLDRTGRLAALSLPSLSLPLIDGLQTSGFQLVGCEPKMGRGLVLTEL